LTGFDLFDTILFDIKYFLTVGNKFDKIPEVLVIHSRIIECIMGAGLTWAHGAKTSDTLVRFSPFLRLEKHINSLGYLRINKKGYLKIKDRIRG